MGAKAHVSKWGTSLAVRIPKPIAEQWGVEEGSAIEIVPRGDRLVLQKRIRLKPHASGHWRRQSATRD